MASGDSLLLLSPLGSIPTSSNYATLDSMTGISSPAEAVPVLDFDQTTIEYSDWYCTMPRSYSGGGTTLTFYHSAGVATGNVGWNAAYRRVVDDTTNLLSSAFTYDYNEVVAVVPSSIGCVDYDTLAFTAGADMDGVTAGDYFILRVKRNTGAASNAAADCSINAIEIKET